MTELFDNRYQFVKDLGRGGFGKVFLAIENRSDALVAIKQLNSQDKSKQDGIIHEMRMISKFNHPHIVNYKHHFIQDELLYIVMEYCPLGSLRNIQKKEAIVSEFVWKWMDQLTETLELIHSYKVVHHDIKPDNILFTENRTLKISDFGVANKDIGTIAYMSPESFYVGLETVNDARVDVYALGVTLLELLTRSNPFAGKTFDEIVDIHERKDFGMNNLPNWQQEIILKAIAKIPELRFQSMKEFKHAIHAQSVPIVFHKNTIRAGDMAEKAEKLMKQKKWQKAGAILDYAETNLNPNVNVLQQKGKYYLHLQKIDLAKSYYEKALKWNPRLDVQKELGWINLEKGNYPTAISLLSDHLHLSPSDYEAYNLLLQCYYETNRYEPALDLAKTLNEALPTNRCFENNLFICNALLNIGNKKSQQTGLKMNRRFNPILEYNHSVLEEKESTHNFKNLPTLKSKLLFMDYRFDNFLPGTLYCTDSNIVNFRSSESKNPIIKFGRETIGANDVKVPGGTSISRRHCLIVNCKNDMWLYDLKSTGTYVNKKKVEKKAHLIGKNAISIGSIYYEMTDDKNSLF